MFLWVRVPPPVPTNHQIKMNAKVSGYTALATVEGKVYELKLASGFRGINISAVASVDPDGTFHVMCHGYKIPVLVVKQLN